MHDPVLKALQTRAERIDVVVNGVQQTWHVWNRSHTKPLVLLHGGSGRRDSLDLWFRTRALRLVKLQ